MLPLSYIVQRLTTLQQLKIERSVQNKVTFDSPVLAVLNGLLLGENKKQIIKNSLLNKKYYAEYERPIYTSILDLFELKATNARDSFLAEVHHALYNFQFENDQVKTKALENIFHQMKRYGIEQESAPLLHELYLLNLTSPLKAVYQHLKKKYAHFSKINNQAFAILESMNEKLSAFLNDEQAEVSIKDLKQDYKNIRTLNAAVENNTSLAILSLSKLLLVVFCDQQQLMMDEKTDVITLFKETKEKIYNMPFGIERFYMFNILQQAQDFGSVKLNIELEALMITTTCNAPNFAFAAPMPEKQSAEKKQLIVKDYLKKVSAYSIPVQNSFMIRSGQI